LASAWRRQLVRECNALPDEVVAHPDQPAQL
jgi:hypothetical protein